MKTLYITYLLVFISINLVAQEKEQKVFVSGYIKNLHEFKLIDTIGEIEWTTLLHNRLNFKYIPSNEFTVRLELRNRIFYGANVENIADFSNLISRDDGVVDLSWNWIDDGNFLFNTSIDRALINYTKGDWEFTLGRQRINWGMNLVWNPNDIFNTYNFLDFDYEERPGSDALRVQYYLGDFSKIELVAKKGAIEDDYVIATMYKFNTSSYDIQLLTGIYQKDWVVGAGWAGNIKNAGFKGELSYFVPYEEYLNSVNVLSASVSVDYGFKKGLYINGSFLYNSNPDITASSLGELIYFNLNAKNLMPFKYSAFLLLSKEFSPIISAGASFTYSPTNHTLILIPDLKYSIATNWELYVTSQSFFELEDHKTLGNSFYIRLRWSF